MALKIPDQDRIFNVEPLPDTFDPNDPTQVNADWIMNIFDKIVNGNYPIKSFHVYPTYDDMLLAEEPEKGQTGYVLEQGYEDTFFMYNGTTWKDTTPKCSLQVTCSYNDDVIKGVAVVVDETTITTKNNGIATFIGLNGGSYTIQAAKDGYNTNTSNKIIENPFETTDLTMLPIYYYRS